MLTVTDTHIHACGAPLLFGLLQLAFAKSSTVRELAVYPYWARTYLHAYIPTLTTCNISIYICICIYGHTLRGPPTTPNGLGSRPLPPDWWGVDLEFPLLPPLWCGVWWVGNFGLVGGNPPWCLEGWSFLVVVKLL